MAQSDTDILISGAGLAGLILAALLAREGWRVCICDPAPPPETREAEGSDLRSTAYLVPSREVMERAGVWESLAPDATPLEALRAMDSTGWPPRQTAVRQFEPGEMGLEAFGWNIANWRARKSLAEVLEATDGVDLRFGVGFRSMVARDDAVFVTLGDGTRIAARLLIGADGHASPVRQAAGIGVRTHRYGQKALAFAATHADPHRGISTEIYNSGGATVTVPLPDHGGRSTSAVVWMDDGARALSLMEMDDDRFSEELTLRTLSINGRMRVEGPRRLWPILTQTADRLTARRVALVAEAAHVLPPIGAQGLNTSIADISALAGAIRGRDPGAPDALEAYERARKLDIGVRSAGIDVFNRICRSGNPGIQMARSAALKALGDLGPLRRGAMAAGLGRGR